jgi:DMSO/TMAO reductase YedYZ heme-binding membrane subunit
MKIQRTVYAFSLLFSLSIYLLFAFVTPAGNSLLLKLEQTYGLTAFAFLYFTLLAGPFCYTFKSFPYVKQYLTSRKALGISTFYFAVLHSTINFFFLLGGFEGLQYLDNKYLLAISFGFIALCILFVLTITSIDWLMIKLQVKFKHWKLLHRLIYFAGLLILAHALLLGTHFSKLSSLIPQAVFFALAFLFILEAPRIDGIVQKFFPKFHGSVIIVACAMSALYFTVIFPIGNKDISFDIHSQHMKMAEQAQKEQQTMNAMPGMQGDRSLRYTVSFSKPDVITPNQEVPLTFKVYDASNGNPVSLYRTLYEKPLHLLVVNDELTYFKHIHPTLQGNEFHITTAFPTAGKYRLYLQYQPLNAIEQHVAFLVTVGQPTQTPPTTIPEERLTDRVDNYKVELEKENFNAAQMTAGKQTVRFKIIDIHTDKPVTTLQPYLGAFGHLTMINTKDHTSMHVHPSVLTPPAPDARSGPYIDFIPMGMYGAFTPGTYRVFMEFNPDGKVQTADFTIHIK